MLLTFDCYGTLIDWETGILEALRAAWPESAQVPDEMLGASFHAAQNRLKTAEYRPYRALLTEAGQAVAREHGWGDEGPAAASIPESVPTWRPFPDTSPALSRLRDSGARLGILSNIDDDLLAGTLEHFDVDFDLLGTAERLRSYKPADPHFELGARWASEPGVGPWLHIAQSQFHDIVPASRLGIDAVWVNRLDEARLPESSPVHVAPDLAAAADWILSRG